MVSFLKLSKLVVNLECIQQIHFDIDPPTVSILWTSGYEETIITGQDALDFMDAVDSLSVESLKTSSFEE